MNSYIHDPIVPRRLCNLGPILLLYSRVPHYSGVAIERQESEENTLSLIKKIHSGVAQR
jgi:hypothetical protein